MLRSKRDRDRPNIFAWPPVPNPYPFYGASEEIRTAELAESAFGPDTSIPMSFRAID